MSGRACSLVCEALDLAIAAGGVAENDMSQLCDAFDGAAGSFSLLRAFDGCPVDLPRNPVHKVRSELQCSALISPP
jgi:hypothetical protein